MLLRNLRAHSPLLKKKKEGVFFSGTIFTGPFSILQKSVAPLSQENGVCP